MLLTISDGTATQNVTLTAGDIASGVVATTFASPGDGNTINVSAFVTDVAGNVGTSANDSAVIDTTMPAASIVLDADVTSDDIINAAEAGTDIAISGSVGGDVQTGDTVTLTVNGKTFTGAVDAAGNFSIDVPGSDLVADGDATIDASVSTTDVAGNTATASDSEGYSVDTDAPSAPTVVIVEDADNDGFINSSELSGDVDVEVSLPADAEVGDVLTISDGTATQNVTLTAGDIASGVVGTTFPSPGDGNTINVSAFVTDVAGNVGTSAIPTVRLLIRRSTLGSCWMQILLQMM